MWEAHLARVLIIDDESSHRELAETALRSKSPSATTLVSVGSLAAAGEQFAITAFDLVVIDLNLVRTRGLDTLRAFRRVAPVQPFVVITAAEEDQLGPRCIDAGAEDYVQKDRLLEELPRAVEFTLRRRARGTRPAANEDVLIRPISISRGVGAQPVPSQAPPDLAEIWRQHCSATLSEEGVREFAHHAAEKRRQPVEVATELRRLARLRTEAPGGATNAALELVCDVMVALAESYRFVSLDMTSAREGEDDPDD